MGGNVADFFRSQNEWLTFDDVILKPQKRIVKSRDEVSLDSKLTRTVSFGDDDCDGLPIVSAVMDTVTNAEVASIMGHYGAMGALHRFQNIDAIREEVDQLEFPAIVTIGKDNYKEAIEAFRDHENVVAFNFDIAYAYSQPTIDLIDKIKTLYPDAELIVGNVGTPEAVGEFARVGADAVKIGIGPGGMCTTRMITGHGSPQLTALAYCAEEGYKHELPIIADGGIRYSGDIVKALAAGASSVMMGTKIGATEESPAPDDSTREGYKLVRGMASEEANRDRAERNGDSLDDFQMFAPEGVEKPVKCIGSLEDYLSKLDRGICSGISYGGAKDISGLQEKAEFLRVTPLGSYEGTAHGM